jgi:hypothetical protein
LVYGIGIVAAFGIGGVLVPTATIAVTVTPDSTIAVWVALSLCVRAIGSAIGYAIYYNIFINKITTNLPKYVAEFAILAGLPLADVEAFVDIYLTAPQNITSFPRVTSNFLEGAALGTRWAYSESLNTFGWPVLLSGVARLSHLCLLETSQNT